MQTIPPYFALLNFQLCLFSLNRLPAGGILPFILPARKEPFNDNDESFHLIVGRKLETSTAEVPKITSFTKIIFNKFYFTLLILLIL